jgi:hypothetical protein
MYSVCDRFCIHWLPAVALSSKGPNSALGHGGLLVISLLRLVSLPVY